MYTFAIEHFTPVGENDCEIKVIHQDYKLNLEQVLEKLKDFVNEHPEGSLLRDGYHLIEYEIDGAELSCWIDYDY